MGASAESQSVSPGPTSASVVSVGALALPFGEQQVLALLADQPAQDQGDTFLAEAELGPGGEPFLRRRGMEDVEVDGDADPDARRAYADLLAPGQLVGSVGDDQVGGSGRRAARTARTPPLTHLRVDSWSDQACGW